MATNLAAIGSPGLQFFTPFKQLTEQQQILLANNADLKIAKKGHRIFADIDDTDTILCILKGKLEIFDNQGNKQTIEGGGELSERPLLSAKFDAKKSKCISDVKYLTLNLNTLQALLNEAPSEAYHVDTNKRQQVSNDRQMLFDIYEDLRNNKLVLPSIPEVALNVRSMIDTGKASTKQIGLAINADPSITAKLIRAANSPIYHGTQKVTSSTQAVVRLGLKTTRQLITSFAMKELFKIDNPLLKREMDKTWLYSISIASVAYALAKKVGKFDPEEAMMVGLLHNIGVIPILQYASRYPDVANSQEALQHALNELKAEISALVLNKWGFPQEAVEAAHHAHDWSRNSDEEANYCDLLITAQLLHYIRSDEKPDSLPALDDVPAVEKVIGHDEAPEISLQILDQADKQIREMKRILSH